MNLHCFRAFLFLCLTSTAFADFFFGGSLRQFSASSVGFNLASQDGSVSAYASSNLNLLSKPTFAGPGPSSITNNTAFNEWWNGAGSGLSPYTIKLVTSGTTSLANFDFPNFMPALANPWWTLELMGQVPVSGTPTWTFGVAAGEMFVYINGVLQSTPNLWGVQDGYREVPVSVSLAAGTYPVHVFVTHRRSALSRVRIQVTDFPTFTSSCGVTFARHEEPFFYPYLASNMTLLLGAAVVPVTSGNALNLSRTSATFQGFAAWSNKQLRVQNGFRTHFTWSISGCAAGTPQGFAFVIQSSGLSVTGGSGPQLGYGGITNSLAVEFDLLAQTTIDPASPNPHIEVHSRYASSNSADRSVSGVLLGSGGTLFPSGTTFAIGTTYQSVIEYQPGSSGTGTLKVYTGTASPDLPFTQAPVVTVPVDDVQVRSGIAPGGFVYAGFTTVNDITGCSVQIPSWRFWETPVNPQSNVASAGTNGVLPFSPTTWNTDIARAGATAAAFQVHTHDICGTPLGLVGDVVTATLLSSGGLPIGNTTVLESPTGFYSVQYWHRVAEPVQLWLSINGQNMQPWNRQQYLNLTITAAPIDAAHSRYATDVPNATFFSSCSSATPCRVVAGQNVTITITAFDQFGNINSNPTSAFSVNFIGDNAFVNTGVKNPPLYQFTGIATRATVNTGINVRYIGVDVGTAVTVPVPPTVPSGTAATPTPIGPIDVVAAIPADANYTSGTLTGSGYAPGPVAGTNGTFTVNPIDIYNNLIQGSQFTQLPLPQFSLTCNPSAITNDTAAACTAWSNSSYAKSVVAVGSQWQFSFNSTLAMSFILAVSVNNNNVLLPNLNLVTVSTAPADGRTTLFYADQNYTAGTLSTFTFQARDSFGNFIRQRPSGGSYSVSCNGASVVCDSGQTGSSATVRSLSCSFVNSGLFTSSLTPSGEGNYTVTVTWSGALGGQAQNTLLVVTGPPDPVQSTCVGQASPIVAGSVLPLWITSRDRFANLRTSADDSTLFIPSLQPQLGAFVPQGLVISPLQIFSPRNGSYLFTLTSQTAGFYDFKVLLLGNPLADFVPDPFTIQVIPSYGNATTSLPSGPGVQGASGAQQTSFNWQSVDTFGNPLTDALDTFVVAITKVGSALTTPGTITPQNNGQYRIAFTAPTYTQNGDMYNIAVQLTSQGRVTTRNIGPLPLADPLDINNGLVYYGTMNVATGVALKSATSGLSFTFYNNSGNCLTCGACACGPRILDPVVAGVVSGFNITDRDRTPFPNVVRAPATAYVVQLTTPTGAAVPSTVSKLNNTGAADLFTTSFFLTLAGNYTVAVAAGGGSVPTVESQAGLSLMVVPGPLNPPTSDVSGFPTTVTAGLPVTYGVRYRDQYTNAITTNTNSYTLAFNLSHGTDITPSVLNITPNPIKDVAGGNGVVNITFTPTKAGISRVDTRYSGTKFGSPASVFEVTVNPTIPDATRTCIFTVPADPPAPAGCANPLPGTIVAGKTWNMILYVRDQFGNGLVDNTQQFNVSVQLNGLVATATAYTGGLLGDPSAGRYTLSLTPTKRVVHESVGTGNTVQVIALTNPLSTASSKPPTDIQVANTVVNIDPADVDSTMSFVTGMPVVVKAGTQIVFQLNLRDRFDNSWFDNPARISITAVGPGVTKSITIGTAGSTADGLLPKGSNPFANYTVRYTPTKATDTAAQNFSFVIRVDGVVINPTNLTTVEVIAADPYAPRTTYNAPPRLGGLNQWLAGDKNNITLQLVDVYGNLLHRGGNRVNVTYLTGAPTCMTGNNLNVSAVTTVIPQNIVDNSDGTYIIWVNTTKAGTYTGAIYVENVIARQCLQTDTAFNILPLAIYPPASIITGDAVLNPRTNIAGEDIKVDIVLNDKYGNRVCLFCTQAPCTTCIADLATLPQIGPWTGSGSITPSPTPTLCENPGNASNWIDLSTFPINNTVKTVELSNVAGTDPKDFGTYRITFQAQKARTWELQAALNLLSNPGWQMIGQNCVNLTILPSYVYTFNLSQTASVWAGIPAQVSIDAWDRFDNVVLDGPHYWLSTYAWPTANKQLIRYSIASRSAFSPTANKHVLSFVLHWPGSYDVVLTLKNNPGPALNPTRTQSINVTGATCGLELNGTTAPFRCMPQSTCYTSSYTTQCGLSQCPFYCAGGASSFPDFGTGCKANACNTPTGRCRNGEGAICSLDNNAYTSWCAASAAQCPSGATWDDRYPDGATAACSGWYRYSAAGCPAARVCNEGMVLCTDGVTCVFDPTECFMRNITCTGSTPYSCEDGRCVMNRFDCPTPQTCASGVICPDGSCQPAVGQCPSVYKCYDPAPLRCQDGSCRSSFDDCPSRVTCPPGWLLCESGHCVQDSTSCSPINCSISYVRCPDGSCRPTFDLCATGITCPTNMPVLCPDHNCVSTASMCPMPRVCPTNWIQCPRGQCAPSFAECGTGRICPAATPVLCYDGTCRAHATDCGMNQNIMCAMHRPYRCPDGACAASYMDCPAPQVCPSNAPVRCASGGCVPSHQMCPNQTAANMCSMGLWRCPGGGCAPTLAQCPTAVTCQVDQIRCGDGSCRSSCTSVIRPFECAVGLVECPNYESGYTCAISYDNCPQAPACPRDRPVRCADRSCQITVSLCPPLAVFTGTRKACPGNMWTDVNCGHSSVCPPQLPVKCWDETCRLIAEDCPSHPLCSFEAPSASKVQPYVCPNGACGRNLFECTTNQPCSPPSWVKCPGYAIGTGGRICAPNVTACSPLTNTSTLLTCPDGKSRCYDSSCRDTCPPRACPHYISYLCPDGKCARKSQECNGANGCPPTMPNKCSDGSCMAGSCTVTATCPSGSTLCDDGSCSAGNCTVNISGCQGNTTRCYNGQCAASLGQCTASSAEDYLPNGCPGTRAYRCPDGYCAISSAFCPVMTQDASCATLLPFRCADGSCALTGAQCPYVAPCPCDSTGCYTRCGDGSCRPQTAIVSNVSTSDYCPLYTKCTGSTPFMCSDGLCAGSAMECVDPWTGCPMGVTKQSDGTCSSTTPSPTNGWNGCLLSTGSFKCWDGSCVGGLANCPTPPVGCSPLLPSSMCGLWNKTCPSGGDVRCADGSCASSGNCKTAMGCPLNNPVRCADGQCKRYPANGDGNTTYCTPVVVCPPTLPNVCADGTCVADPMHCSAFWPCPSGKMRCMDFTCRDSCPALTVMPCPPGAPTLCPSGACVKSYRECGPMQGEKCPTSAPFKCFDGTCQTSPMGCATIAAAASGSTWSATANPDTALCNIGETYCWNGMCLPTSLTWSCPPVPSCPVAHPYRCADGHCANRTAGETCTAPTNCASGTQRCEDGLCRTTCPLFHGCSKSLPLMCPTQATYCMSGTGDGSGDYAACTAKPQAVCGTNCFRDIPAVTQTVTASVLRDTIVDIAISNNAPSTWIEIPAGAFGDSTAVRFTPATQNQMASGIVAINNVPHAKTFPQAMIGTPFTCSVDSILGGPGTAFFPLNLTVYGAVDRTLYDTSTEQQLAFSTPCEWIGTWDLTSLNLQYCGGSIIFGADKQSVQFNLTNTVDTPECSSLGFTGTIVKAPAQISGGWQVTWNVTSVALNNEQMIVVGQNVCTTLITAGSRRVYMALGDASLLSNCVDADANQPLSIRALRADNPATFTNPDACQASANSALIQQIDICFGQYEVGRKEYQCYGGYYERYEADPKGFPSWASSSGRPGNVVRGRMRQCKPNTYYGFFYVPLPPPPRDYLRGKSAWERYGKIVLGVSVPVIFILCLLAYAIWRLKRYRDKYKEEQVEANQLREQAAEIAETHGGLGVWDEEVQMVSNPLVLQFNEQKKKLDEVDKSLEQRVEMDRVEMEKLDKERQIIVEEMNRLKQMLQKQQEGKKAQRVDDAPTVQPAVSGAPRGGGGGGGGPSPDWDSSSGPEQHTFQSEALGAKPRKKEI